MYDKYLSSDLEPEFRAFLDGIVAEPTQYERMLVLADWLDDRSEMPHFSYGLRWMAFKKKFPVKRLTCCGSNRKVSSSHTWAWYSRNVGNNIRNHYKIMDSGIIDRPIWDWLGGISNNHYYGRSAFSLIQSLAETIAYFRQCLELE